MSRRHQSLTFAIFLIAFFIGLATAGYALLPDHDNTDPNRYFLCTDACSDAYKSCWSQCESQGYSQDTAMARQLAFDRCTDVCADTSIACKDSCDRYYDIPLEDQPSIEEWNRMEEGGEETVPIETPATPSCAENEYFDPAYDSCFCNPGLWLNDQGQCQKIDIKDLDTALDSLEDSGRATAEEVPGGEVEVQDIEDAQDVVMKFLLPEEDRAEIEFFTDYLEELMALPDEDIGAIEGLDTGDAQSMEDNRDVLMAAFEDSFSMELNPEWSYEGEAQIRNKLVQISVKDSLDEEDIKFFKDTKAGHSAAEFFSEPELTQSQLDALDAIPLPDDIAALKETAGERKGTYDDLKQISQLKGAGGDAAKALYLMGKTGEKVADKVPLIGETILKPGAEVVTKTVMVLPGLDSAIVDRFGEVTSGERGTSTPNAYLAKYGKTNTEGKKEIFTYTDDNGRAQEVTPELWQKKTLDGRTYWVPVDGAGNRLGDVAIQEVDSYNPFRWDNVNVVKYTDPNVKYDGGVEKDL